MNLKKILRNGLITIGLSTLALAPLTAEDSSSLIKKLNPTGLMAISGGVHKDGTSVIALHYDEDNDGVEDSMMLYNYGNLPDKTTIVHPKECFDDLNKNGIYEEGEKFAFETNKDRDLSIKNPADFLKQINPGSLVIIDGKEDSGVNFCYHSNGGEDARITYGIEFIANTGTMFVRMIGYNLDLNRDGKYSEDEKFLVEDNL